LAATRRGGRIDSYVPEGYTFGETNRHLLNLKYESAQTLAGEAVMRFFSPIPHPPWAPPSPAERTGDLTEAQEIDAPPLPAGGGSLQGRGVGNSRPGGVLKTVHQGQAAVPLLQEPGTDAYFPVDVDPGRPPLGHAQQMVPVHGL